jgi:DNA-binding MarR family transcriptional regulator
MSTVSAPEEDLAKQVVMAFAGFGPNYLGWVQSRAQACGVSFARMKLLGVLHRQGPMIMSSLSSALGVTPRNVTTLVDGLEKEGLVRRKPHPTDRRATLVEMTASGEKPGCVMGTEMHLEAVAELFAELPPADQTELIRILTLLRQGLARRGFGTPP